MHKLNMTHRSPHIYGHKLFCGIAVFQSCQIFFILLFIANTEGNILTFFINTFVLLYIPLLSLEVMESSNYSPATGGSI